MVDNQFFINFRNFIEWNKNHDYQLYNFKQYNLKHDYHKLNNINIQLDKYKEIVLQEDTKIEIGGIDKQSFCLVYPTSELELIEDGKIHHFGPEIKDLKENVINFGIFILIGLTQLSDKIYNEMRSLNFISNSIEGFQIRSVPRKFWARISSKLVERGFSFSLLGQSIMYLYSQKFKGLIKSIEIVLISSNSLLINEFINLSSPLYDEFKQKFKKKIEEWAKRIDCEYDWGCEICPYQEDCHLVKQTLIKRENLEY
jgi:CO dehydrogenase/acetyl-CoA synthase beta subunit